ncbi:MAG TPA: arginyltransferase [Gammaproteobacteria bacterium]|jgi:arginine-tRNA-protein transferase|nr:arginyltransferase [Gammaproteobacteria bacterium]|tara:strand:- start:5205 stop:5924 length:720 start_codon:yes stop_codon:yes gene_type:complete
MKSNSKPISSVRLFRTSPHPCSYKTDQRAATVFVDPDLVIDQAMNSKLSELGYRRSGSHLYRPDCDFCNACISCRLPVEQFVLTRRFKKIWNSNQDLEVIERNDLICKESYALYEKYINTRHRDGDMYPASLEQFEAFIKTKTVDTRFYLFYQQEQLVAVSVTDILEQGLSAVYTFFDPTLKNRSLGYHVILWQVQQACSLQLPYLFLGYWIKNCPKMQYKSSFRPLELLVEGNWRLAR